MATTAHCAYCFDVLDAHFTGRRPLRLAQVEQMWEQYHATDDELDLDSHPDGPSTSAASTKTSAEPSTRQLGSAANASTIHNNTTSSSTSSSASTSTSALTHTSHTSTPTSSSASSRTSLASSQVNLSSSPRFDDKFPLFVTWNTLSRSGRTSLRGCIGTFAAKALEDGLQEYALTSALDDTRFSPISGPILPTLSVHVTLLTNFSQPKSDPMDWVLGLNGIRIAFTHRGRRYGSTYLPDVAKEQGWSKEEALISLMQKAGWSGHDHDWQRVWREGRGELITYEGRQVGITYKEWKAWRDWVASEMGQ